MHFFKLSWIIYLNVCVFLFFLMIFFLTACDVSPELRVETSGRSRAHP